MASETTKLGRLYAHQCINNRTDFNTPRQCFVDGEDHMFSEIIPKDDGYGGWYKCHLKNESLDHDEIDLPLSNGCMYVSTAITLLDRVIEHHQCHDFVYRAALMQWDLCQNPEKYNQKPEVIAYGERASFLIIGLNIEKKVYPRLEITGFRRPFRDIIVEHALKNTTLKITSE